MDHFVAWLASLDTGGLAALLHRRPDAVTSPAPNSLGELGLRLMHPYSVASALADQPAPALQLAEVIAALGGQCGIADITTMLGRAADDPEVDRACSMLSGSALLWPDGDTLRVPSSADVWDHPLHLGPPAAQLLDALRVTQVHEIADTLGAGRGRRKSDSIEAITTWLSHGDNVRRIVDTAPPGIGRMLVDVAATGPVLPQLIMFGSGPDPHAWATARGMLFRVNGQWSPVLTMPREVAIALRGADWTAPFDPQYPTPHTVPASTEAVERDSAAAATDAVRAVATILDSCSTAPVRLRKTGGVGVREVRRLSKLIGDAEPHVTFWLDLAEAAGLLDLTDEGTAVPTARYDAWRAQQPADALLTLIEGWHSLQCAPLYWADDGPQAPLSWPSDGGLAIQLRWALLSAACDLPVDAGVASSADLTASLAWRCPLASKDLADADELTGALWHEAELLGVVAHGTASDLGRALTDPARLATVAARLLPAAERTARFQADLTAVVTGPPASELSDLLDSAADRESRGNASVWRFSTSTVRSALDTGGSAAALAERLRAVAAGGSLPQPLAYLIADVGRRHGQIRVRAVACCLRADDPVLLAEIRATRALAKLSLTELAPTVLASGRPLPETLKALRAAGYAPVAESTDAAPVLDRIRPARADSGPTPGVRPEPTDDLARLASRLLAAGPLVPDDTSTLTDVRTRTPALSPVEHHLLAAAIDAKTPVFIEYVNAQGNTSQRVIERPALNGTALYAYCTLRQDDRFFTLSRIRLVAPPPLSH